ncbi:hypothetical protein R1sor_018070 [Riccia sorocarpa]|uniref:Uncharacterized protein n=1 Tax=Riccia sorocarpa TaxID=122646 RepID=A0ABD3I8M9_9MARC
MCRKDRIYLMVPEHIPKQVKNIPRKLIINQQGQAWVLDFDHNKKQEVFLYTTTISFSWLEWRSDTTTTRSSNMETGPLLCHAEIQKEYSSVGERKRSSARRLSMLTRSGEDLGWGKRACQIGTTWEDDHEHDEGEEMAEHTVPIAVEAEVNGWANDGSAVQGANLSLPVMRANPATAPQLWWEELMRAEAGRGMGGWHPSQIAQTRPPNLHSYIPHIHPGVQIPVHNQWNTAASGIPTQNTTVGCGIPQAGLNLPTDPFLASGNQHNGLNANTTRPASTSPARVLPSLRDIMAEQSQQNAIPANGSAIPLKNVPGGSPKSYANAAAPEAPQKTRPPRQTLSGEEVRKRVADILEILKPIYTTEPSNHEIQTVGHGCRGLWTKND